MSAGVGSFAVADYVVFAVLLMVSAAVGIYYAWVDRTQRNSGDFLTGSRRLTALPVSLSLTASFMSAISVLSNPAEVYLNGANIGYYALSYMLTMLITSEVFLPVFYKLSITSTYEYLELRFNRATRMLGTLLFITQTILYTGIVIYTPALALNQVTGMDLWGAVVSTGIVCTFYCTLGGLRAVVWTDVIQLGVMLAGFLVVIIQAVIRQGGVLTIIEDSNKGGRLNFMDFDPSPLRRHTFWTLSIGGTFIWTSVYGINQAQVQRYISCKSMTHARLSLYTNLLGLWSVLLSSVFAGLCLYSVYKDCDPWTSKKISASDQLMPFLVIDILRDHPGLPGLFVAAAFSGSLSTVSSSINALAAVTVEDLIKPHTNFSEKHLTWFSKAMSLIFGVLCIGMAGVASLMGAILEAAISIFGIIGGPLLGLFSLGILVPFANSKGALLGLLSGLVVSLWVGVGAHIHPHKRIHQPLSLSVNGCNNNLTANLSLTLAPLTPQQMSINTTLDQSRDFMDDWYSLSYMYFSPVGTIVAILVGVFVSVLTGGGELQVEPKLMIQTEDTIVHHLLTVFRGRGKTRRGNLDLKPDEQETGNTNPVFSYVEMDLTKISSVP